ncbi:MAG: tyrosine-type recombinase/integrase [Desulfurococcaceae archaeon]
MKKYPGLYPSGGNERKYVDSHAAVVRDPEVLLQNWLQPIKTGPLTGLSPSIESKSEAEKFIMWLNSRKEYASNTIYTFVLEFRRFAAFLATKGKGVRDFNIEDYIEFLSISKADVKTVTAIRLYVRFLYDLTGDMRYKQLLEKIKTPQPKRRLPETLTREQVEKLLEECGRESLELKVLVALVYETGARVGEILQLKCKDVVFDDHGARISLRRSKSQPRVLRVVLYAHLLAQYMDLMRPGPEDPIFAYDYNYYLKHLTRAWKRAGLPKVRRKFHVLRHTRATELLRARVFTEKEMMLWFGWRTRDMIDVYSHITMEDVERAYLAAVKSETIPTPQPPKPVECTRCKAANPPDAQFCYRCGLPLKLEREGVKAELQLSELLREVEELKRLLLLKKEKSK